MQMLSCKQVYHLRPNSTSNLHILTKVWFQDLAFRSGVYKCQPLNKQNFKESPIFHLQVTFAALQEGNKAVFNPVKLVESLRLRTTEQQDAQEYVTAGLKVTRILNCSGSPNCS